jgi:hypothetical protein
MENRSATQHDLRAIPQGPTDEARCDYSLSETELHSLVQFFELLDRWDREVVQ